VQITYTERKDPYERFSYQIKLLGVIGNSDGDASEKKDSDVTTPNSEDKRQDLQEQRSGAPPNQPVYRTTNTIEKLIAFTQNLQKELTQTQKHLSVVMNRVQQLEDDRQQFREINSLIADIQGRISRFGNLDSRIQYLEADRQQIQELQQTLRKFLIALNQQTRLSLQEHEEDPVDDQ
jgi:DNA repair exonuclease SbcCD ATPase subunit